MARHNTKKTKPAPQPNWLQRHPRIVLCLMVTALLAPFLNKAAGTDDPLFIWSGKWIQHHPLAFYSFDVNWWKSATPMYVANWNPPLMSFYLAVVCALLGWDDWALHTAVLGITCAAAVGIYSLAQRWCSRPLFAAMLAVVTPVFLVSASTVMCDMLMLALWVWAIWFWERGFQKGASGWWFAGAGLLAGLAVLAKFTAMILFPVLLALAVIRTRRPGWWLGGLLLAGALVLGYDALTAHMYGVGMLKAASYHSRTFRVVPPGGWKATAFSATAFAGGCLLPLLFLAPVIWGRWVMLGAVPVLAGLGWAIYRWGESLGLLGCTPGMFQHWPVTVQSVLLVGTGISLAAFLVVVLWRDRDWLARVMVMWCGGSLFFATVMNWTISARSFLPLAPVVAILLVRRLDALGGGWTAAKRVWWLLLPPVAVSLVLVQSDYRQSGAQREAAQKVVEKYQQAGHQIWFEGHCGFQYYLEQAGGKPLDVERSVLEPGDVVVVPEIGIFITFPPDSIGYLENLTFHPDIWMNLFAGPPDEGQAGFYCNNTGPLPYAIGESLPLNYTVYRIFCRQQYNTKPTFNDPKWQAVDVPSYPRISALQGDTHSYNVTQELAQRMQQANELAQQGRFAESLQDYQDIGQTWTNNPVVLNNYASILLIAQPFNLRNPALALQLSRLAVSLTQCRQAGFMLTMAQALAVNGDFPNAVNIVMVSEFLSRMCGQSDMVTRGNAMLTLFTQGRTMDDYGTAGGTASH